MAVVLPIVGAPLPTFSEAVLSVTALEATPLGTDRPFRGYLAAVRP